MKKGFTFVEVLVGIGLSAIIFLGLYGAFQLGLKVVGQSKVKNIAIAVANQKIEQIRNLPYFDVGTVGAIPLGEIPQTEQITSNSLSLTINTSIAYIDDDFDDIFPNDSLPADYKKAQVKISWQSYYGGEVVLDTTITPKGIETEQGGGTLVISVFNAYGLPVNQANVNVFNDQISPAINANYTTDTYGRVILAGASTSTQAYKISASSTGYNQDRTYGTEEVANPSKPHASVFEGQVTEISFSIDETASLNVDTRTMQSFDDEFDNYTKISIYNDIEIENGQVKLGKIASPIGGWWDEDWIHRQKITFLNSTRGNLDDVPVLIKLTSSNFDFSHASGQAKDIRFTDSDNQTELYYEIEYWNHGLEEANVWVKVPRIDGNSDIDFIYMYFNNPQTNPKEQSWTQNTWSNNYITVWHMDGNEDDLLYDSTGSNTRDKPSTWIWNNTDTKSGFAVEWPLMSQVGDQYVWTGRYNEDGDYSATFWYKGMDSIGSDYNSVFGEYNAFGWSTFHTIGNWGQPPARYIKRVFYDSYDPWDACIWAQPPYLGDGVWDMVTLNVDYNNSLYLFKNGQYQTSCNISSVGDAGIFLGPAKAQSQSNALIDEFRLSSVTRSNDWISFQQCSMEQTCIIYDEEDYLFSGGEFVYTDSGWLESIEVSPLTLVVWDRFIFDDEEPAMTDAKYYLYFTTSTEYTLIPDADLPGNSTGFDVSSIDISSLDVDTYYRLKIRAELSSSDVMNSPAIDDWHLIYNAGLVPDIVFHVQGLKTIGTDENEDPVYKYSQDHASDYTGYAYIPDLEWDSYNFTAITGLDMVETIPVQPVNLLPGQDIEVILYFTAENTLLTRVLDASTTDPIFGANVRLYRTGYDYSRPTDENGLTFFMPLEQEIYNLEVVHQGYEDYAGTVNISGDIIETINLNYE